MKKKYLVFVLSILTIFTMSLNISATKTENLKYVKSNHKSVKVTKINHLSKELKQKEKRKALKDEWIIEEDYFPWEKSGYFILEGKKYIFEPGKDLFPTFKMPSFGKHEVKLYFNHLKGERIIEIEHHRMMEPEDILDQIDFDHQYWGYFNITYRNKPVELEEFAVIDLDNGQLKDDMFYDYEDGGYIVAGLDYGKKYKIVVNSFIIDTLSYQMYLLQGSKDFSTNNIDDSILEVDLELNKVKVKANSCNCQYKNNNKTYRDNKKRIIKKKVYDNNGTSKYLAYIINYKYHKNAKKPYQITTTYYNNNKKTNKTIKTYQTKNLKKLKNLKKIKYYRNEKINTSLYLTNFKNKKSSSYKYQKLIKYQKNGKKKHKVVKIKNNKLKTIKKVITRYNKNGQLHSTKKSGKAYSKTYNYSKKRVKISYKKYK